MSEGRSCCGGGNSPCGGWRERFSDNGGEMAAGWSRRCVFFPCAIQWIVHWGIIDHSHELAEDLIVSVIQFIALTYSQVTATPSKLEPDPRFFGLTLRITQFNFPLYSSSVGLILPSSCALWMIFWAISEGTSS